MTELCPIRGLDRIVLAADGSDPCTGAVREAVALAKKCGSTLVPVTVVETNEEYSALAPDLVEREEQKARDCISDVSSIAAAEGVPVEPVVHEGEPPWEHIVEEARKQKAELIVMGRRGRTGLARVAMGSVTASVIGHAPADVLVVPRDAHVSCDRMLIATDGSRYSEAAAREAIAMAKNCGAKLTAISVASSDADMPRALDNVNAVRGLAAEAGTEVDTETSVGKAYIEIVAASDRLGADLIVVGCHGRTGLARLLMGSVSERVIGHADAAVLVACA